MALIVCPDCGKKVSDKAEVCPSCGYPFEKIRKEEEKKKRDAENLKQEKEMQKIRQEEEKRERENRTCTDCGYYSKEKFSNDAYCSYYGKTFLLMSHSKAKNCNGYFYSQQSHDRYTGKCYLTTACCEYYNKSDDCLELTALRAFRDNVLLKTDDGKKLVEEYYQTAPQIVDKLKESNDKENFSFIYDTILQCIKEIENNDYDVAINTYKNMVFTLKNKLN